MFAARLILRRVDKVVDTLHRHISHTKASLKVELAMNHQETLDTINGLTASMQSLQAKVNAGFASRDQKIADQAAQIDLLSAELAATKQTLEVGATTPDEDQALDVAKQTLAALDASIPA